jgi:hypothetical protein
MPVQSDAVPEYNEKSGYTANSFYYHHDTD